MREAQQAGPDGDFSPGEVARARADTPGCAKVAHFNNAGAALMPRQVIDASVRHLRLEADMGGYEAAAHADDDIEAVYDSAARLLGCDRDEIALLDNATRAWDMAFYGVPFRPGDRVLTSMAEYGSNFIAYLQVAERYGVQVDVVPNDEHGQISVDALRELVDERVRVISVTHVPTNGGLVNPAAEVGKIAREAGALYLLDACQSVGQLAVDVREIGCDLLSATGRKYLRGPRGTGLLYVRRAVLDRLIPPVLDLHAATWTARDRYEMRPDARRFETWEANYAAQLGLGAAIDHALGWGLPRIQARVTRLAATLREQLTEIPGVRVHDLGLRRCGITTFTLDGVAADRVRSALAAQGINVSVSRTASTRLDMDDRGLGEVVRASVHYYNTQEEITALTQAVRSCA
ncbi:aminotransferase class V-fold PLP-dependent enzyme [Streptomyces sp. CdTB01]|uniref:aminotransferase class V-fold PLP-dependent enzyme n=1 Tax=Streptomyces sp. CdTB01 TaxID=1725411 RepID=UPI00073A6A9C|nr:aminotransferase class V-fold PLP-dependent enzyme [Streptomyces sp. CdTB01]ALV33126.1 aminotransferase class V [Streptomyces sp. CdTB01]